MLTVCAFHGHALVGVLFVVYDDEQSNSLGDPGGTLSYGMYSYAWLQRV